MLRRRIIFFGLHLFLCACLSGQSISFYREKIVFPPADSIFLDTSLVVYSSLKISRISGNFKDSISFRYNPENHFLIFHPRVQDTIRVHYRILPVFTSGKFYILDSSSVRYETYSSVYSKYYFRNESAYRPGTFSFMNEPDGLQKNGSISRGISIGNNQNASLQSQLNLQVSGKLSEDIEIEMVATDNSIPFQPDGTTAQLQEFDRVYITAKTPFVKLTAGDFQSRNSEKNHFLKYFKRLQGLQAENTTVDSAGQWKLYSKASFAVSKGKFSRQVFFGTENNQGPYRLRGASNEPFIIVLSGTERIYVDGKLLERGQDKDYIIDYNTAELRFTARMPITKDKRIVAEFQYAERNYARSLLEWKEDISFRKMSVFFTYLSEQDNPNRGLQQMLTPQQKSVLYRVGDSMWKAISPSAFPTGFNAEEILYVKKDTVYQNVIYKGIYVYKAAPSPSDTFYKVSFSQVGSRKGNYIRDASLANGRVFRWVPPVNGTPSGDYEPVVQLVPPKKYSMLNAGSVFSLNPHHTFHLQAGISENDLNRFSPYNKEDNRGYATMAAWNGFFPSGNGKESGWISKIGGEFVSHHFNPFERFRSVEFERDWSRPFDGKIRNNQTYLSALTGWVSGSRELTGQTEFFQEEGYYRGTRSGANIKFQNKYFFINHQNRYLESRDTARKSFFFRHASDLGIFLSSQWKAGYKDMYEQNIFTFPSVFASPGMAYSYRFYQAEPYAEYSDSVWGNIRVFYRERLDKALYPSEADSVRSVQTGGECRWNRWKNHPLFLSVQFRSVQNKNKKIFKIPDQQGFFNRLEYQPRFLHNLISAGIFAESGYGVENRLEYYYLEVVPGQGQFAWIDYNADGIKQLNEFEPARFPDQAKYIRIYVPTANYIRVLRNQMDVNLTISPSSAMKKENQKKRAGFVRRFQWQAIYRGLLRYAENDQRFWVWNMNSLADSLLQAANSRIRLTTFFNTGSPLFGAEHSYQRSRNRQLINFSLDNLTEEFHEMKIRYTIRRVLTVFLEGKTGVKNNTSMLFFSRNYFLKYYETEIRFSYQPGTDFRISVFGKYAEKSNRIAKPDLLYAHEAGVEIRYNLPENGSIQARGSYIENTWNGNVQSTAAFEMLNALQPGRNWVWEGGWQQNISKNLQGSIFYQGRKSSRWIHTGTFEVRAFF